MSGAAVFHFSMYKVPEVIQQALAKWQWTVDDCRFILLHQANKTMVDTIYRALGVPPEKTFYFMEQVGNVAGASSPLLLAEALRQGQIRPGDKVVVVGFGNGLSWGAVAIEWS
jgi:3-oxoacyl-[acyl-carrier-protein] synthase III